MPVIGYHATSKTLLLRGRSDQTLNGFHVKLLNAKVFAVTHFTSPADSLVEYPSVETFSSGISPAQLV